MDTEVDAHASKKAQELYESAVSETPLNRTQLDHLVDFLRANPTLLFSEYFEKGYNATEVAVGAWHGHAAGAQDNDDPIAFLSTLGAWGWSIMEDTVCSKPPTKQLFKTKYPQLIDRFLNIAERTMKDFEHTPVQIVRRAIQAITRFWPQLFSLCIEDEDEDGGSSGQLMWSGPFENMKRLASTIHQIAQRSDDPSMLVHIVKLLEVEATIFSPVPQNGASRQGQLSIDRCPDSHAYLQKPQLQDWGSSARQLLMSLLPSNDTPRLFNTSFITAVINSVIYLMNLRPQFVDILLKPLMGWYNSLNSSNPMMNDLQSSIINKTIRISLFQLYRRSHMGAHAKPLEDAMDELCGPEWIQYQTRMAKEKERQRARERSRTENNKNGQREKQSSRWVPANEEDEEAMADQPAPMLAGVGGAYTDIPPPPPPLPNNRGQKRPNNHEAYAEAAAGMDEEEEEDEEQQFRMLEESAKRVKLETSDASSALPQAQTANVAPQASSLAGSGTTAAKKIDAAAAATAAGQPQATADVEMEEEIRAALHSGPFELPPVEKMTADTCAAQIQQALERVISGSKAIRKLIEHKSAHTVDASNKGMLVPTQQHQQRDISESGAQKVLPNGQSTNAGVLEDSMLMLVRLISNCYILYSDIERCSGSDSTAKMPEPAWSEIHASIDSVLEYILKSPQTHYGLAQLLLYEMWLAVMVVDPGMENPPKKPGSEYSVLSLYSSWCQRAFDRIVQWSAENAIAQDKAQVVPDSTPSNAGAPVPMPQQQQQQHQQQQQQIKGDRLMVSFITDVPYLAPQLLRRLQGYLSDPKTSLAGVATLKEAVALRPPLLKEGLEMLLTYSVSPQRDTRTACILAVKKYYTSSPYTLLIEKFARTNLKIGISNAAAQAKELDSKAAEIIARARASAATATEGSDKTPSDPRAEIAALRKSGEPKIEACLISHAELFLALCTRNMELFSDIFDMYASTTPLVQAAIYRIVYPLVQSCVRTPAKLIPVLARFPKGAEKLALRVIMILTAEVIPSPDLVQAVVDLYEQHRLDEQCFIFIANGMEKDQIQRRLPQVIKLLDINASMRAGVRDFFARLTQAFSGKPSCLSPTELLMMLHSDFGEHGPSAGRIMEAVQICLDNDKVFTTQIYVAALKMMFDQSPVPPLVMSTAELCYRKNRSIAGIITKSLEKLVARKVWEMGSAVFEAFVKCCQNLLPSTHQVLILVPTEPLKQMLAMQPGLRAPFQEYVRKMSEPQRARFKWVLDSDS
ncbi:hypothetical protein GGI12_001608 [Dipsacomyces acuminosporus]|nr:hypothetical protein GGI12_001608 [Dipsacomyces acuminosporus]